MNDKLHHLAKRYEEIDKFPSKKDAESAYKDWNRQLMHAPLFWLGYFGYIGLAALLVTLLLHFLQRWIPIPKAMYGGLVGGMAGGTAIGVSTWLWRRRFRKFLRGRLVSFGVPICIVCGYDLRGLSEPRCPECGTTFDPALLRDEHEYLA